MTSSAPTDHGAHLTTDLIARHGRRWLDDAVACGRLTRIWRGVVVESRRLLDPWTRAEAGLLRTGPEAVITGVTAVVLHGCTAMTSVDVHVLLPYRRQARPAPGLVVHRGSFFESDVEPVDGLRVLGLNRVAADLLCSARPQDALALADEVLRLSGDRFEPTRKEIAGRIAARPDPRGTVRGAFLLDLASPGAESVPESWLRHMLIERGFPVPEVNWSLCGLDGTEIYRLDLAWPVLRIVVEYDGYEAHLGRADADAARAADLGRRGWIVVRVTKEDLGAMTRVDRELRSAFAQRGYRW